MAITEFFREKLERLKDVVSGDRFNNFCAQEVFELILAFTMEERSAVMYAKRLVDRFGSVSSAIDAPMSAVTEVLDGDDRAASLFELTSLLGRYTRLERIAGERSFYKLDNIAEYCLNELYHDKRERIIIVLLDADMTLLGIETAAMGASCSVDASYERIAELLFSYRASNFVVVHNHVGKMPVPSDEDIIQTGRMAKFFECLGKKLTEHIIVAEAAYIPIIQHMEMNGIYI